MWNRNNPNSMKIKLKDLIGSNFIFYKKGDPIKELQKQCGLTRNDFVRKTPTNDEGLNTVAITLKNKPNTLQRMIAWGVVRLFGRRYDWDWLREQMKNDGYNPEINPIVIQHPNTKTITTRYFKIKNLQFIHGPTNKEHRLVDGNHRLRLLKELYGGEYEVEVRYGKESTIKNYLAKFGINIFVNGATTVEKPEPCHWCSINNIKKYFKTFFNKLQFVRTIKILISTVYVLILNFKYLLMILSLLFLYDIVVRILKRFNYDPTKVNLKLDNLLLKKVLMTILSNIASLTLIIPLIFVMYYMIANSPINFIVFSFLIWVCGKFEEKYKEKDD